MAERLILSKPLFDEAFFILSTGLAKEILQKWINYHIKAAIWGDFSRCAGKPLARFYLRVQQRKALFLHRLQGGSPGAAGAGKLSAAYRFQSYARSSLWGGPRFFSAL